MSANIRSTHCTLQVRELALRADAHSTRYSEDHDVWRSIVSGRSRVAELFVAEFREYLIVCRLSTPAPELCDRDAEVLERILLGTSQKVVAIDMGLSFSALATMLKRLFATIGLEMSPSRTPLLLTLIVQASRTPRRPERVRHSELTRGEERYDVLSTPVRQAPLEALLPPAESAVVHLRAQGLSHAQIAAQRRTSERTVANQLANAFRRLGVSGRADLIAYLSTTVRSP